MSDFFQYTLLMQKNNSTGDYEKPLEYTLRSTLGQNMIFLNHDDQRQIGSDFVDSLPWNTFGRKNVGYLFAIACGAKVIWDFDDDNLLKFWLKGASPDPALDIWNFSENGGGIGNKNILYKVK